MDKRRKRQRPKLKIPYCPTQGGKVYFINNSRDSKIVADYMNISVPDAESLDIFEYWGFLRDAWIYNCNQTESGREYLENAYYYSQENPINRH